MKNLGAINEWRNKQDHPERMNHPSVVWRQYQRSSSAQQDEHDANREPGERPDRSDRVRALPMTALAKARDEASRLRRELEVAHARITELEEELAQARACLNESRAAA